MTSTDASQNDTTTNEEPDTTVFDDLESGVQVYARNFPVIFDRAEGVYIYDTDGKAYLDFLAGAGSLNYGHNHPVLRDKLIEYIQHGGITHGLDLYTDAKEKFLQAISEVVFQPRDMDFVVQFPGPTGTNAVEAALKLARNLKKRHNILCFTNGFHGVTNGALAATGNSHHRDAAGIPLIGTSCVPYDGYIDGDVDTIALLDKMLSDNSGGIDHPAAAIVETVQGEGGLNTASFEWLRGLEKVCRKHDMLLIIDDIQAGCGRTGTFFSFDNAGISPDIITLSKSLSGYGLPFSVVLMRSDLDNWKPGEHNGTFRGNNHAFITAATALRHFWSDDTFAKDVQRKSEIIGKRFAAIAAKAPNGEIEVKGRGMMQGLSFRRPKLAARVSREAFDNGLIIETAGPNDEVVKPLIPLIIDDADLNKGLDIIDAGVTKVIDLSSKRVA